MLRWPGIIAAAAAVFSVMFNSAAYPDEPATPDVEGSVVFFYYQEWDPAVVFYRDVLQLQPIMNEEWVKIYQISPGSHVGLVKQGHGYHEVSEDKPAMLSIITNEVDAWHERLVAAGVTILKAPPPADQQRQTGEAPIRGFIAQDPGGYTVEFFSWQLSQP